MYVANRNKTEQLSAKLPQTCQIFAFRTLRQWVKTPWTIGTRKQISQSILQWIESKGATGHAPAPSTTHCAVTQWGSNYQHRNESS